MIRYQLQSGFSLVETLVAITILLIVVVGPMTISTSTARSTNFSSEQTQAFFLAQEGAELMQAYRDDELLDSFPNVNTGWSDFESISHCFNPSGCGLDVDTDGTGSINVYNCGTGDRCQLFDNFTANVRSRFTHTNTGTETPFTRVITAEVINAGSEIRVQSTVTWRSGNLREDQQSTVVTYLFNVYENI